MIPESTVHYVFKTFCNEIKQSKKNTSCRLETTVRVGRILRRVVTNSILETVTEAASLWQDSVGQLVTHKMATK